MTREAIEREAASVLIVGYEGLDVDEALLELVRAGVGGVIFFRRNIGTPGDVVEAINGIQAERTTDLPLVIGVDQEGGRVTRLGPPVTPFPAQRCLGKGGSEALAERFGRAMADELDALGFNLDFAPVVDVDSNPENPVIGDRAFSDDPAVVARLGAAVVRGIQNGGILACAKHFPGHGDTISDSHLTLPVLPHSMARLDAVELVPFRAVIRAGVATIMSAHVLFEALDPQWPATLSPTLITGLLRSRMGFQGVVISDDLEMNAVLEHYGVRESIRRGLLAGIDAFLICRTPSRQHEAWEALVDAASASTEFRDRLHQAARRMETLRSSLPPWRPRDPGEALTRLGRPEHLAVRDEMARFA